MRGFGQRGKPEDEPCTATRSVLDVERAIVGVGDLTGEGESQTGAALVPAARGVEAGEAFEDALPIGFGDALTVVADGELGSAAVVVDPDADGASRVALGVVEEVAEEPADLGGDRLDLDAGLEVKPHRVTVVRALDDLGMDAFSQIHLFEHPGRIAVDLGEQEQVGDDGLQPVDVAQRAIEQLVQVRVLGVQLGLLQQGAQPGQWGAQLMRSVGGELALPLER